MMNPYVEKLKTHLMEQTQNYGYSNASSLLEMLYCFYTSENPIDSESIRARFESMDDILSALSLKENNEIFGLTCDLCMEYERRAFLEGLHVGVRLITELSEMRL